MGRIAVPEMLMSRYDRGLAAGTVAAAGTIGSMIPPSILLLLYGIYAELPISKLFIAGLLPGLLTAVLYSVMIASACGCHRRWRRRTPLRSPGPTVSTRSAAPGRWWRW